MAGPFSEQNFGDGSNRWIPGIAETLRNPVDRVTNPYDTIAGAADAAALNFDEGVGGLVSLTDNEPGNTAGPGGSPWLEDPRDGQEENPTRGTSVSRTVWAVIIAVVGLVLISTIGKLITFNVDT